MNEPTKALAALSNSTEDGSSRSAGNNSSPAFIQSISQSLTVAAPHRSSPSEAAAAVDPNPIAALETKVIQLEQHLLQHAARVSELEYQLLVKGEANRPEASLFKGRGKGQDRYGASARAVGDNARAEPDRENLTGLV